MFFNKTVSNFNFSFRTSWLTENLWFSDSFLKLFFDPVNDELNLKTEKSKKPNTQHSTHHTIQNCFEKGRPLHTHIVCALASAQGIEYVKKNLPQGISLWVGAVDEELTAQAYIVPGLGDAGDLAFGEKS